MNLFIQTLGSVLAGGTWAAAGSFLAGLFYRLKVALP
jgi:hypothetical protein